MQAADAIWWLGLGFIIVVLAVFGEWFWGQLRDHKKDRDE